jgi:hypothetical protein
MQFSGRRSATDRYSIILTYRIAIRTLCVKWLGPEVSQRSNFATLQLGFPWWAPTLPLKPTRMGRTHWEEGYCGT